MATAQNRSYAETIAELEQLADEIRLKVHLASMDAKDTWNQELEPRLLAARTHAHDAKEAGDRALHEIVRAFKAFSESL